MTNDAAANIPKNPLCVAMRCEVEKRCIGMPGGCLTIDVFMNRAPETDRLRAEMARALNFIRNDNPDYAAEILEGALSHV